MRPLLSLLSLLFLALPARGEEIVEWQDAAGCVGRVCSLRGTVVEQKPDGPVFRLYFDSEPRTVYVTLIRGWLVTWPNYAGQRIVATGRVDRFRDHIEMIVTAPESIVLADVTPLADATATAVSTPTTAPDTPTMLPDTPAAAATPTAQPVAPTIAPPATAPAAIAPPTPGEVERLRDRVRELEDRVRELESR